MVLQCTGSLPCVYRAAESRPSPGKERAVPRLWRGRRWPDRVGDSAEVCRGVQRCAEVCSAIRGFERVVVEENCRALWVWVCSTK